MNRIPIQVIQARANGMVVIPDGYAVVRPNQEQKEYIKQQFPDKPLSHTILVTRVPGNSSSIRGDPELSKPKCRSLSKYASDKPDPSRETSLSVIRTLRKDKAKGKGKDKGKGKKRPSDKGETRKDKKAKARKKQGKKKRRKTKRRKTKRRTSKI